eukprot:CAMPEP_0176018402 /NCGR_PEP_ID=MMETSP0120_2-20121206/8859_1 /TAXON_ID=160619 /ORGANISM="Kryptoperidinium foliaceum, Strain CCMP 1326" /LENGTH=627 /DNA_ID=CAMNT_0017351451 /DNA_START=74 /DNA_END=1955 /DNA_ORIENTATION=-
MCDTDALLEWLDLVDADYAHERLEDLADGATLLRVMHDLDPEGFPSPDVRFGGAGFCPPSDYTIRLLEGLEALLRGRGEGADEQVCSRMLQEARAGESLEPSRLTKLVLIATIENDLPRRKHYIEKMLSLSYAGQEAVRGIVERFQTGSGLESPNTGKSPAGSSTRPMLREPGFSPPSRSPSLMEATPKLLPAPGLHGGGARPGLPLPALKEQYIAAMEGHERLAEERAALRQELEAEKTKRREAEEAERVARLELKLAEEARDRMKEEQRSLFDLRLEQEVGRFKELLKEREYELEGLRDEVGLLQSQAAAADRLANQLEHAKHKIEEQQAYRRENDEMKKQLEEVLTRPGAGAGDHLHRSLARAREELLATSRERDEAQRQTELLRQEVAREQASRRKSAEDLAAFRRQYGLPDGAQPSEASDGTANPLAVQAGVALLAAAAGEGTEPPKGKSPPAPQGSSGAQEIKLLTSQKDDLLERLLAEKERATRAETTMQVKAAEVSSLTEQRMKDASKIGALEAQLQSLEAQLRSAQADAAAAAMATTAASGVDAAGKAAAAAAAAAAASAESSQVKELQSTLALRERELQVLQWRGQSENQALVAQETFMASCFHEVGLRYQKLLVQN